MKRVLLGWAALLAQSMAVATGFDSVPGKAYRGKRSTKNPFTYKGMAPEYARYWHDATDEAQRPVIQAAHAKRHRRALKREKNAMAGCYNNPCLNGRISNLNPFYVAN